ncbi:TipAS antibiotic-recognition domain-containing protein [Nocardia sp. NPDC004860]|uniref:TipAS antibiotic-recognition domain-containing protein n=1 Tax=Nocardia sp. NPDC004860 TaxID=3154557 RepID=UPI0033B30C3E
MVGRAAAVGQCEPPDAQMFEQLAQTYLDDPTATASFDQIAPGLATCYRDAMVAFADTRLT